MKTSQTGGREFALHLLYQMDVRGEDLTRSLPELFEFLRASVINDSKEAVHVRMDGKSITGIVEKDLAPGESLRAAGHTLASSQDVSGTITYSNGDKVPFWGYNPDIGWPSVGFGDGSNWERFSVGETHHFTESGHQYSVHRNGDLDIGGGKDFQISVK